MGCLPPGEKGLEVGGDWYDAFWLEEGETLAIVVCDVSRARPWRRGNHGQLRSACARSIYRVRAGPCSRRYRSSPAGTLSPDGHRAYAELDVRLGCMRTPVPDIRLGHRRAGARRGVVRVRRRSPRSDCLQLWSDRPEGTCQLSAEAIVVLYTDGLIERRNRPRAEPG